MTRQASPQSTAGQQELTASLVAALSRPEFLNQIADAMLDYYDARTAASVTVPGPAAPVLDIASNPAQTKAGNVSTRPPGRPVAPARPISLHALRTVAQPPEAPSYALWSVAGDGTWRWAAADVMVPTAPEWESLAAHLVASSPFRSLHITAGLLTSVEAATLFQHDGHGTEWVKIVVDRRLPSHHVRRVIGHELAHVADETARVELTASLDTWRSTFTHPHRSAQAEAFAYQAEEWVEPHTRAADLIAAARRHQKQRGPRR
ncbi:hypothetical protein [Streptomyces sp. NBC_00989]|uniref:hypothetical protein n=1 Tax=Streptomyces sp. NBC_00989 TaxID=2903705 RepID=UPI0038666FEA|nr:hypothetical protein OG714_38290 [Streptomyces sp. NBC_00989]